MWPPEVTSQTWWLLTPWCTQWVNNRGSGWTLGLQHGCSAPAADIGNLIPSLGPPSLAEKTGQFGCLMSVWGSLSFCSPRTWRESTFGTPGCCPKDTELPLCQGLGPSPPHHHPSLRQKESPGDPKTVGTRVHPLKRERTT